MTLIKSEHGKFEVESQPCSWQRDSAKDARALLILGHGAGAPYTSDFMQAITEELVGHHLSVARFHFPYMEQMQQSGKRRPPNGKKLLLASWRTMLDVAATWQHTGPIIIGGKSMGGRIASMLIAQGDAPEVSAAIYLGYPLHPSGKPEKLRRDHLPAIAIPQLFVQGSKDALCRPELLQPVLKECQAATLHNIEGGDHSWVVRRKEPLSELPAAARGIADWIAGLGCYAWGYDASLLSYVQGHSAQLLKWREK